MNDIKLKVLPFLIITAKYRKNILAGKLFFDDHSESFDDRDKYFGGKSIFSSSLKINYVVLMCFSSYFIAFTCY